VEEKGKRGKGASDVFLMQQSWNKNGGAALRVNIPSLERKEKKREGEARFIMLGPGK